MTDPEPLVSVIVPTHNRAGYICAAVDSVLQQRDVAHEVIVVDDRSTDDTLGVLRQFDDAVRVVSTDSNIERGAARNLGASAARGRLLAFLDSDDIWMPDKLAAQVPPALAGRPSVTGYVVIDAEGSRLGGPQVPRPPGRGSVLFDNPYVGGPSSLVVPTDLFSSVGGFRTKRELQGSEDWIFFSELRAHGADPLVIPDPLIGYRRHPGSSTSTAANLARSMWSAVGYMEEAGLVDSASLPRLRARTASVIARNFAITGDWGATYRWSKEVLTSNSVHGPMALAGVARSVAGRLLRSVRAG